MLETADITVFAAYKSKKNFDIVNNYGEKFPQNVFLSSPEGWELSSFEDLLFIRHSQVQRWNFVS